MSFKVVLGVIAVAAGATVCAWAQDVPDYKMVKSVSLGSPDRWDYLTFDPQTHRVYVAHGDRLSVVDGVNGTVIGEVGTFPGGTHGIAISTANGRGYTDDGKAGTAQSFDLTSLKSVKTIKAEEDADGIALDPTTGHVFVINGDSGIVTAIDPKADTAIAKINAGGKLEFGVADDRGKVYVNGAEKKEIVRIDAASNTVDARWPIPACTSPHGLAIDTATHRLFSSCVNSVLVVVNTDSGAVVASVPIGKGTDAAAFDPKRKLVFSSNGIDGTLSVIRQKDADTYMPVATVKTAVGGKTMAIDPDSGRLFIAAGDVDPKNLTANGRPQVVPGSLKILFFDPTK